jgi:broad specificity phosphatase PhoE
MSRNIYFITHPEVVIDPAIPIPQWPLSERGWSRMRRLLSRDWIPQVEAIYCSTEQKALDGAAIISEATRMPFHQVAALGEHDRSATGYLPRAEFEATIEAFLARPSESIRGWERAVAAQSRLVGALERIAYTTAGAGSIAVVSHRGGLPVWGHTPAVRHSPLDARTPAASASQATSFLLGAYRAGDHYGDHAWSNHRVACSGDVTDQHGRPVPGGLMASGGGTLRAVAS